ELRPPGPALVPDGLLPGRRERPGAGVVDGVALAVVLAFHREGDGLDLVDVVAAVRLDRLVEQRLAVGLVVGAGGEGRGQQHGHNAAQRQKMSHGKLSSGGWKSPSMLYSREGG